MQKRRANDGAVHTTGGAHSRQAAAFDMAGGDPIVDIQVHLRILIGDNIAKRATISEERRAQHLRCTKQYICNFAAQPVMDSQHKSGKDACSLEMPLTLTKMTANIGLMYHDASWT